MISIGNNSMLSGGSPVLPPPNTGLLNADRYIAGAAYDPVNDKFFVVGGYSISAGTYIRSIEKISGEGQYIEDGPLYPLAGGTASQGIAFVNGELFVLCGASAVNGYGVATSYKYTETGGWSVLTPAPEPMANAGYALIDGEIHIAHGHHGNTTGANVRHVKYNCATGIWTLMPNPVSPGGSQLNGAMHTSGCYDGSRYFYIVGGYGAEGLTVTTIARWDKLGSGSGAWVNLSPNSSIGQYYGCWSEYYNGYIYIFYPHSVANGLLVYRVDNNTYYSYPAYFSGTNRNYMKGARRGDYVYLFGGYTGASQKYIDAINLTTLPTP